ncbi:MAG TPA: hypothetical protein VF394_01975 [Candidatus Acidoferrum sp.]
MASEETKEGRDESRPYKGGAAAKRPASDVKFWVQNGAKTAT